jgi:sulfur-oxidizing protein SoxA
MIKTLKILQMTVSVFIISIGSTVWADHTSSDSNKLMVEDQSFVTNISAPSHMDIDEIYSGWTFRKTETQALQMDDFDNPAMLFVDKGIDLWNKVEGSKDKACASCHADAEVFKGLRTVLPRWNASASEIWAMEDYINNCRTEQMGADPLKWGKAPMDSLVAVISLQSRGLPMNVKIDGDVAPIWEKGKELYYARVGQLDMSCANCHEDNYGVMIRADHLSQGQINGFPTYRLKNAKLNSIHARFKGCMKNIRATPHKVGGEEFKALELYLASRGTGLSIESPSVRN